MELEHHKEQHGHWSEEESGEDTDTELDDVWRDMNGNPGTRELLCQETVFGPDVEERILLCNVGPG